MDIKKRGIDKLNESEHNLKSRQRIVVIQKDRIIYLEIIRIIAAFFVVFNHTDSQGYMLYMEYTCDSWRFWVYMIPSICCKVAVPLFFCISGVLLLNRDESLKTLWKKRILRMAIDLFVFSLAYAVFTSWKNGTDYNLMDYLHQMYSSETYGHLWYLYAYIAFLISAPFLRILVKNLSNQFFLYMIVICMVVSLFQLIETMFGEDFAINKYLVPVWSTSWAMIYPCIGYYLHYRIDVKEIRRYLPVIWGTALLSIFIVAILNYVIIQFYNNSQNANTVFVLVNCIAVFLTVRYLFENRTINKYIENVILVLGNCTFGIYLLHIFVLQNPVFLSLRRSLLRHLSAIPMIGIWIFVLFVVAVCVVVTYLLKKIPLVKRLF